MSKQELGESQERLRFLAENIVLQDKIARVNTLIEMTSIVQQLSVLQLNEVIQKITSSKAIRFLSASGVYGDARTVLFAKLVMLEKEKK